MISWVGNGADGTAHTKHGNKNKTTTPFFITSSFFQRTQGLSNVPNIGNKIERGLDKTMADRTQFPEFYWVGFVAVHGESFRCAGCRAGTVEERDLPAQRRRQCSSRRPAPARHTSYLQQHSCRTGLPFLAVIAS